MILQKASFGKNKIKTSFHVVSKLVSYFNSYDLIVHLQHVKSMHSKSNGLDIEGFLESLLNQEWFTNVTARENYFLIASSGRDP